MSLSAVLNRKVAKDAKEDAKWNQWFSSPSFALLATLRFNFAWRDDNGRGAPDATDIIVVGMGSGDLEFNGKVVLVTGGQRGIGAGIVRAFARRGARCIVNYVTDPSGRNEAGARALVHDIEHAVAVQGDVSKASEVAEMMEVIKGIHGGIDFLVNNAGVLRDRTMKKMTDEEWSFVLRVNLDGTFYCTRAAAEVMRPGGRIVNLSSVSAIGGFYGQANYSASKAGIIALTKVAARELARQKINVNAIAPGFVDTDMVKTMPEEVTKQFVQQIPLGRVGTIDDIAGVAMFLCSNLADYVTGQVIHVNGGFWMP